MNPPRPPPTPEQLNKVFRSLADRHAEGRSRVSVERSWNRLQSKLLTSSGDLRGLRLLGRPAFGLRTLLGPARLAPALLTACVLVLAAGGWGLSVWSPWSAAGAENANNANLSYEVRSIGASNTEQVLQNDGWLRTGLGGAELSFSDGSRIEMSEQSALRVQVTGEHGAQAELDSGRLHADILHTDTTRWQLHAGPYRVDVVGTKFDLAYGNAGFALVMHAGRVRVTAPQGRTWTLDAGQDLHLPAQDTAELQAPSSAPEVAPEVAAEAEHRAKRHRAQSEVSNAPNPGEANSLTTRSHKSGAQRGWPQWVAKGQFQRVLDEAKALGSQFPGPSAGEAEITAAAQAAGYSGDARFAERCWRYLRQHHARSTGSLKAAFYLARISEQRGELKAALDWLGVYNKESPGGALAAEALGRQLSILRRIDPSSSRTTEAAQEYLRRFPEGAHREAAQATLGASRSGR